MSTPTTDALTLLASDSPDTWPQGILAAADLRENRAEDMRVRCPGPYKHLKIDHGIGQRGEMVTDAKGTGFGLMWDGMDASAWYSAEHIAAEANPAHALAAVHRWRGVADLHAAEDEGDDGITCEFDAYDWPCLDLTETADEARAYLGGAP